MEHDEKALPIDIRLLGALAEKVTFVIVTFFPDVVLILHTLVVSDSVTPYTFHR